MKKNLRYYLFQFALLSSSMLIAQVGIGTTTPNGSAVLDLYSETKGMLMPRLTSAQRDVIFMPANGLMIYNSTLNDGQINTGTPEMPNWIGIKTPTNSSLNSVTKGDLISTTSTASLLVPDMSLSPVAGTYSVFFNAQMVLNISFSSSQGITDINSIYNQILNFPGGTSHALVFGNGEVLLPGIYDVPGATSIAGTLTLDGGGNPDAVFIIRGPGAFTTGANTTVNLIGGASSNNVYWLSGGAMSTGATSIMKGTLIANTNAVSLGVDTQLEGRMFTTTGAITMGANSTLTLPVGASPINLGVLSSFVMFTPSGAISGCATCAITGDVGTASGAASNFNGIIGTVYPEGTMNSTNTSIFSIYKNDIEVPFSSRTITLDKAHITLQAMVTTVASETIEVRWKVASGSSKLDNRILSIIRL